MADIPARLPAPLSSRIASTSTKLTARSGRQFDYAIAGVPFLSAASVDNPMIIETADMKKDQFDSESEPGEQSLQGWWLRSQDSWHGGSGYKYQESRQDTNSLRVSISNNFRNSSGIDPWNEGQLTLLRRLVQSTATSAEATCLYVSGDTLYVGVGPYVGSTPIGATASPTILAQVAGETWADITVGRDSWYAISETGKLYTGPIDGSSNKNFVLTNADTNIYDSPRLAWAKHRLFATVGRHVYVVDTTLASGTSVAPLYSHPSTDWAYTDIAEGPACVYLSGWSDAESAIQKVTLTDDGNIPQILAGVTTAVLPRGERVGRIAVLAGTWLGMATTAGFRLGALDTNGDVQYGPLTLEPKGIVKATAVTAWSRWLYVAWRTTDGAGVVYRVDASTANDDGSFPWAKDVETTTVGYFKDLAMYQGRVIGAFAAGVYPNENPVAYFYQHPTDLVDSGWIDFGMIRYRTTENKLFKYVSMAIAPLHGTITVDGVLPGDTTIRLGVYSQQGKGEVEQFSVPSNVGPLTSFGLKVTLARDSTDSTQGPLIHSYSVKAVPAVKPQRLIQLPMFCFDKEMWRSGQLDGGDGWARDRLAALQLLEDGGDLVIFQDFSQDDAIGRLVRIDKVSFAQTAPQNAVVRGRGFGGIATVVLRTMD